MAAQPFWQTSCGLAIGHPGLTWVNLGKVDCYSAFGKLGRGMGGYTIKAKQSLGPPEGMSILQAKAYCGAWVHFLKAQGLPPLTVNNSTLEQCFQVIPFVLVPVCYLFSEPKPFMCLLSST